MQLSALPNEIISSILQYHYQSPNTLNECALVNKQFYDVAISLLWHTIQFDDDCYVFGTRVHRFHQCISDMRPQRLSKLLNHLRVLHLTGQGWTDALLNRLLPHIPLLKHLTLHASAIVTNKSLKHLPQRCSRLTSMDLTLWPCSNKFLADIVHHCHQLRHLTILLFKTMTPETFALLTSCPLQSLSIMIMSTSLNVSFIKTIQTFDHLTCLEIHGMSFPSPLLPISNNNNNNKILWPSLTKLYLIRGFNNMENSEIISFIKSHPSLRDLNLGYEQQWTDDILDTMTVWLPHLTHLTIKDNQHISPEAILRLVVKCPELSYLNLGKCTRMVSLPGSVKKKTYSNVDILLEQDAMDKIRRRNEKNQQKQQQQ